MLQLSRLVKWAGFAGSAGDMPPATPPVPPLSDVVVRKHSARTQRVSRPLLTIACPTPTTEDQARDTHQLRGQFLARQDRWSTLSKEIKTADDNRCATPAGMPVAELLSYGARADVVMAVEHALIDPNHRGNAPLVSGIEALEEMLAEHPTCAARAVTVAQAHMDIGWIWRGTGWDDDIPAHNQEAFEAHFDRARSVLADFDDQIDSSAVLSGAVCALHGDGKARATTVADDFERLIDLCPDNPGPMRALGNYMSPRWFGSHETLALEAHRTAARTSRQLGASGYTWVMFDAIASDDEACARLDVEFFIEGLHDILMRTPQQHTANLLAAFCANTIGQQTSDNDQANTVRGKIADCANWIVREYMTELHPLIWAHAKAGFDNNLRIASTRRFAAAGQAEALKSIQELFYREIAQGKRIVFTVDGPVTEPA